MKEKRIYHALVELDLEMLPKEDLTDAKRRMKKELKKTDVNYVFTHDDSIRKAEVFEPGSISDLKKDMKALGIKYPY